MIANLALAVACIALLVALWGVISVARLPNSLDKSERALEAASARLCAILKEGSGK